MSSFGEELRRERELRRISLREVAEATKINLRYLEALESNDFQHLPGGIFNRGFVRAYAQYIGVDPDAMVNAYLLEDRVQSDPTLSSKGLLRGQPGLGQGSSPGTAVGEDAARSRILKWALLVVLGVGILIAAAWAILVLRCGAPGASRQTMASVEAAALRPSAPGTERRSEPQVVRR